MKIVILKENLKEGLNSVVRAVSENNNLPILKNILIKTFDNKIRITATNLELAITKNVSGKIVEEGSITVPFSVLNGIITNLDSEKVNLESKGDNLILKTDNYQAAIQSLNEEEFPIIPEIGNSEHHFKMDSGAFNDAVLKVVNCAQISEIRPEISGVLFDFQISSLKLVATDSFRLAEKTLFDKDYKANFPRGFKAIVPLKTIQEVPRILKGEEISVYFDSNQVLFKGDDLEIISRLIDGNYPDYEPIIPKNLATECVINRESFLNAVRLVSNFSGKINDVKIKSKDGKKVMEVSSSTQQLGENRYLVPIKAKGEDFEVVFNWRFLLDGLKSFDAEEILLGLNGDQRAAVIKSQKDFSYVYIAMPLKNS
ncbi:MAG: DNA polymerase III subunit beta [Candidatus Pacebacteria bacterium]|nr:DNA polymerase III subunit beta [Candidatus Paceibacterota bacterium]